MTTLRWILGIVTALGLGGWLLLASWGDGFRRSFGASGLTGAIVFVPVLLLGLLLASLVLPEQRVLLHATAATVILVAIGCFALLPNAAGAGSLGLCYCGMWMAYYALALGPRAGAVS